MKDRPAVVFLFILGALFVTQSAEAVIAGWPFTDATQVCTKWNAEYMMTVSTYYTGSNVASCIAGSIGTGVDADVLRVVNLYRYLCGIDPISTYDSSWNVKTQECCLICSANGLIQHSWPNTSTCWTTGGNTGCGSSNLAQGVSTPHDVIRLWVQDNSVPSMGHRRWIFGPGVGGISFGILGSYASLYVFGTQPNTLTRGYWTWPPEGYVPTAAVSNQWGYADTWTYASSALTTNSSIVSCAVERNGASVLTATGCYVNTGGYGTYRAIGMGVNAATPGCYQVRISFKVNYLANPTTVAYNTVLWDCAQGNGGVTTACPALPPSQTAASPVATPVAAPTAAPQSPPQLPPVKPPQSAPIAPPVKAPVAAPVATPVKPPATAPVTAPVAAASPPIAAPVKPPATTAAAPATVASQPDAAPVKPPAVSAATPVAVAANPTGNTALAPNLAVPPAFEPTTAIGEPVPAAAPEAAVVVITFSFSVSGGALTAEEIALVSSAINSTLSSTLGSSQGIAVEIKPNPDQSGGYIAQATVSNPATTQLAVDTISNPTTNQQLIDAANSKIQSLLTNPASGGPSAPQDVTQAPSAPRITVASVVVNSAGVAGQAPTAGSELPIAVIAGAAAGGVVLLAAIIIAIVVGVKRRRNSSSSGSYRASSPAATSNSPMVSPDTDIMSREKLEALAAKNSVASAPAPAPASYTPPVQPQAPVPVAAPLPPAPVAAPQPPAPKAAPRPPAPVAAPQPPAPKAAPQPPPAKMASPQPPAAKKMAPPPVPAKKVGGAPPAPPKRPGPPPTPARPQ